MTNFNQPRTSQCPASAYLGRKPENLLINGYRNWVAGLARADARYWDAARNAHVTALGAGDGQAAIEALTALIARLGICARCPLRFYKPGSGHLCRDECLLLGMVAGAQHGDDEALITSARLLSGCDALASVIDRAGAYAAILLSHDHRLVRVPADILADIDFRSTAGASGAGRLLH
ncbi:hypothetical protein [uncultured Hoeflea sp.]|uniref:hypothetical protein n=1 Tax=uncultured Hoeflea sp. TaxID=538666 RepID=UPI0026173D2C|nr:hypothetical protein [uncultured Hoeflea sp.]